MICLAACFSLPWLASVINLMVPPRLSSGLDSAAAILDTAAQLVGRLR